VNLSDIKPGQRVQIVEGRVITSGFLEQVGTVQAVIDTQMGPIVRVELDSYKGSDEPVVCFFPDELAPIGNLRALDRGAS